jgi:hypothetical protein
MKVLNLLFEEWMYELSIGARVDVKPPVDKLSINGFRKGTQETRMAKLS